MINEKITITSSEKISWIARLKSFRYAWAGILYFFKKEHNARIHLGAAGIVLFLSYYFKVSQTEFLMILFFIVLVWITEMLNTAIERIMDFLSPELHPAVGIIKDIAAGAVLVASAAAFVAGSVIFIPKLLHV
jgi:diacylglycerol kinase